MANCEFETKNTVNLEKIGGGVHSYRVLIGYTDDRAHSSGMSAKELGQMLSDPDQEGQYSWPQRSHLDEGVVFAKDEVVRAARDHYASMLLQRQSKAFEVGEAGRQGIVDLLHSSYLKMLYPNAPSTVAKKGSDLPLIDSGELANSIEVRVVEED
jgi:hypothetical protein